MFDSDPTNGSSKDARLSRIVGDSWALGARATVFDRSIVLTTQSLVSGPVRRPAITLLISLSDEPFSATVNDVLLEGIFGMLVGPLEQRALNAASCQLASINLEPGHPWFMKLRCLLAGRPFAQLTGGAFASVCDALRFGLLRHDVIEPGNDLLTSLFPYAVCRTGVNAATRKGRQDKILSCVDELWPLGVTARQMALKFGVSSSRFSHLFVEQIGIPLRTYVLWSKYRNALTSLESSITLTKLAADCGFSDAAHMTRTFVRYLGFSPRSIRKAGRVADRRSVGQTISHCIV